MKTLVHKKNIRVALLLQFTARQDVLIKSGMTQIKPTCFSVKEVLITNVPRSIFSDHLHAIYGCKWKTPT